jgi:hypothetical protein
VLHSDGLWPYPQSLDRLEGLPKDNHSILLRITVNYGRNKFYDAGPRLERLATVKHSIFFAADEKKSFITLTAGYAWQHKRETRTGHRVPNPLARRNTLGQRSKPGHFFPEENYKTFSAVIMRSPTIQIFLIY